MRFKNLDLNLLVALDHFLNEKSVSKAAQKMHITQSAASNALSRLREYFNDEILIPSGKNMVLSSRATKMIQPVKQILMSIDNQIIQHPHLDPTQTQIHYKICVSDYTLTTFIPILLKEIRERKYKISFDFLPQTENPLKALEYGEVDLLIIPSKYVLKKHPHRVVSKDHFVCISAKSHPRLTQKKLTKDEFLAEQHIVMNPPYSNQSYESLIMKELKIERKVALNSYSFSSLPYLVANSEYLATIHSRLAKIHAESFELDIHELPFPFPDMEQAIQWHGYRESDEELKFLIELISQCYQLIE
ncbi:LysR family transcriptional regulator [Acinetobacter sichuanensis]|uniref:LysR family transcriptional regulator n=1 Tax=Acinetobacter sichuanensis TaxID=2136183 RepID=UPI00280EDE1B|nr:LysR family transcriptional regulator [Acinetobacter sichuanensis]MDQ9021867.1 LysR family transcriptional regulator [Acinetobacter sichuanensis]